VGRKIPLLAEVLGWVHDRNCLAFVEIKRNARARPGIERRVLEEIHRAAVASRALVISFDLPTLRRVRQIDPCVPLGIDFTRPLLAVTRARLIQAGVVLPHWAFASRRFLKRAHQAGLKVVVWDLDEPRWMRRKLADGVDGIITRFPAKLAAITWLVDATRSAAHAPEGVKKSTGHCN
jgi:glycerophosphoryl diester phosphodiesterase